MEENMKNCVVIINYNDYETTYNLVQNIKDYSNLDEIVIVDNASKDDSYEKLLKLQNKKITILKNSSNKGYGSGINLGARYLIDKYHKCNIIVSNPDIVIENEEVISKLIQTFSLDIAVVAPVIREHVGYSKGWKQPTPWQDILSNIVYLHKKIRNKYLVYPNNHYVNPITEVDIVSGCFFAIRSDVLKQIDFFDENVFLYYEENILCSKLKKFNLKTVINTEVEVFHNHSVTIDKSINRINKYKILKKSQMYFEKNYNSANLIERFLLWFTSKVTLGIYYLFLK